MSPRHRITLPEGVELSPFMEAVRSAEKGTERSELVFTIAGFILLLLAGATNLAFLKSRADELHRALNDPQADVEIDPACARIREAASEQLNPACVSFPKTRNPRDFLDEEAVKEKAVQ